MAKASCCQLVGDLSIGSTSGCIISVNVSSSTEMLEVCAEVKTGPTVGNISITGYASDKIYIGCPSQVGVSISWVRKYDCDTDTLYFIHAGEGQSFISGDTAGTVFVGGGSDHSYVSINNSSNRRYQVLNASSTGGPASQYSQTYKLDGYGMTYTGDIFQFNTKNSLEFSNALGIGSGSWYLQSFNLNFVSGALPTASYSFLFGISD